MSDIACEHPRIIINPKLPEILAKHPKYFMRGFECYHKYRTRHKDDFRWIEFSPRQNFINLTNIDDCYVVDESTGESIPIYYAVPCGHCNCCRLNSINDLVRRCQYESQMYDSLPHFFTFTYRNEDLPPDGVSVRDCQLFLKRLRQNLKRAGYNYKIRYVLSAEYGSPEKSFRPHYHCVVWGLDTFTKENYLEVHKIFLDSWSHGFIRHRLIKSNEDDKGFDYTFKYLKKDDSDVPEGKNKRFILSSRGHGGIGSGFIDKCADSVRKKLDTTFSFQDKWTGNIKKLVFSPYVLNRIMPTFCRSVPSEFRTAVENIVSYGRRLIQSCDNLYEGCVETVKSMVSMYSDYFYVGFDSVIPRYALEPLDATCALYYEDACRTYLKWIPKIKPLSECRAMDTLRHRFLSKLFQVPRNVDIKYLSYYAELVLHSPSPNAVFH